MRFDFRRHARRRLVPSMRQKIDIASLYADALAALPESMDGQSPLPVQTAKRLTLDELLEVPPSGSGED